VPRDVKLGFPSFVADLELTRRAVEQASELHRGQVRESDEAAFVLHPLEVASLLYNDGWPDYVLAAAVLHDAVEVTSVEVGELRERFGTDVAELVQSVTENNAIEDFGARKAALRDQVRSAGPEAVAIYAADKVAKARELRARVSFGRAAVSPQSDDVAAKLDHYEKSLEMLEAVMPELPLVRQLRFELEALHALPPRGSSPPLYAADSPTNR
jgi:(p)ppGpp synthase/HD superfamily hydrolase